MRQQHAIMHLIVLLTVACLAPVTCMANQELSGGYINIGNGIATTRDSSYDNTAIMAYTAGYNFTKMGLEIAYINTSDFELRSNRDSSIKLKMWRAQIYAKYPLAHMIYLEPVLGVASWDARASLIGHDVGHDRGNSIVWGVKVEMPLIGHFSVGLDWLEYRDVTGTDIRGSTLIFGFKF